MSLNKTLYPPLSTGSTEADLSRNMTKTLLTGKLRIKTNKTNTSTVAVLFKIIPLCIFNRGSELIVEIGQI